jgi:DNA invertase Pin-like site-specific DNA recombinase
MNAKRIRRVALYVRVSTDHQTIKNQERELRAVADRHGWEIVATFKDEGISGAKSRDERPGLDKLLQAVTPSGKAMFQIMGVFAEFERSTLRERVNAGLARARAEGIQLGRPAEIAGDAAKVKAMRAARRAGKSIRTIAREFDVGVGTAQRLT